MQFFIKKPSIIFHRIISLGLLLLLLQSCGVSSRIKKADTRFELGEYYAAGDLYKSSYGRIPYKNKSLRGYVAFRQGECYRLINNQRAEQAYLNAIRNNYSDSTVFLRYAQVLHRNGKYGEALHNYQLYLQKDSSNIIAKNGIRAIQMLEEWQKNATRYEVKYENQFNVRRASTFSPVFVNAAADELVFTSTRSTDKKASVKADPITGLPKSNLFMVRKNAAGKWGKPEMLEGEINTPETDDGVCSFASNGKTIYFTRAQQSDLADMGTKIYVSSRTGAAWNPPQMLKIFVDSTISVAHPAIAPDGQTIYFVSDKKDGLGGKDIYKATLDGTECKYIENLGSEINTPGDEMFPVVRNDGTLYFSSNGHPGFGGLDIFKAVPQKNGGWLIQNMGTPVNSKADDFGMTFAGDTETGYFSSNRNEIRGYDALWSFQLPEQVFLVEGKVVDDQGQIISDATIRIVGSNGTNARIQTKKDGTFRMKLEKDVDYVMLATARGFLNQKNELSTQGITESKTYSVNFRLSSISKPVKIENIFYEFGKWDLTPASEKSLQELVKLLKDNPNITIELSSHTDYIGDNAFNKNLSEKRAQSVVNYLIKAGIDKERLTAVGYGEEKPIVVDEALAQKYPFLKVGEPLSESYILTLTPEQQEIANQINRRTEFRVLKTTYNLY